MNNESDKYRSKNNVSDDAVGKHFKFKKSVEICPGRLGRNGTNIRNLQKEIDVVIIHVNKSMEIVIVSGNDNDKNYAPVLQYYK
uniref:K Homology domain-containing protein n=1 Tax=Glossina palpalis gambiensis TaxID=67801 RepID=A0A1B0ASN5_9MUSC